MQGLQRAQGLQAQGIPGRPGRARPSPHARARTHRDIEVQDGEQGEDEGLDAADGEVEQLPDDADEEDSTLPMGIDEIFHTPR